jgi:hypothetical protein
MQEPLDALETRIAELRRAIRGALAAREQDRVRELRAELRRAERSWDALVTPPDRAEEDRQGLASLLPAREQVHQALTLLGTPAAPKLIAAVHAAFFAGQLTPSRLASLRRDEERSYRAAPGARPYYLCPALTSDLLSAARALLCVSTWPLEQRIMGPLSPRVDFLTAAIRIAEAAPSLSGAATGTASPAVDRLLRRFAMNIPGAGPAQPGGSIAAETIAAAARAELDIHCARDHDDRTQAAVRARRQLDDAGQLFGARLAAVDSTGTGRRLPRARLIPVRTTA